MYLFHFRGWFKVRIYETEIELFNYNTRFFMVTIDKYKLIRPILSRFSEIYISNPINLHTLQTFDFRDYDTAQRNSFQAIMEKADKTNIKEVSHELYEHGHSALDIQQWVSEKPESLEKYNWLITFSKIKGECSHEELLIYLSLSLYFHEMTISFFI